MEESRMQRSQNASKQRMFYRCTSYLFLIAAVFYGATLFTGFNATAQNDSGQPEARTESGRVIGSTVNGVNEFLGIPYAAPPVGNLRWMPPQPYGPFPGYTLQATQFGSECPQPGGGSASSENCLFLNVYTPQFQAGDDDDNRGYGPRHDEGDQDGGWQRRDMRGDRRHRGLPVMVWMPGGALEVGTGAEYDPSQLVKQGIIVVTINYRLGYLGFFAQSAIDAEGHLNGNYGFMDQQFALKWVRRNIAGFGGDPDNVTISGESAGGQSVLAQLASPLAAGLFRKAISESGAYGQFQDYYNYIIPLAQGETTGSSGVAAVPSGAEVAKLVGCTNQTAACLRAVPAATLSALTGATPGHLSVRRWNPAAPDTYGSIGQRRIQSSAGPYGFQSR
jgi:para-nitrobenzyl esterase